MSAGDFDPSSLLCESLAEWQQRCCDLLEFDDDLWISVAVRLRRWAHAAAPVSQQRSAPIVSPWSRTTPRAVPDDDDGYGDSHETGDGGSGGSAPPQTQPLVMEHTACDGILVQPIVWMVFAGQSGSSSGSSGNDESASPLRVTGSPATADGLLQATASRAPRLVHVGSAPAAIAVATDRHGASALEIGQWHAGQLARLLAHTPVGRRPAWIHVAAARVLLDAAQAAMALARTSNAADHDGDGDGDVRCGRFAAQSLTLAVRDLGKEGGDAIGLITSASARGNDADSNAVVTAQLLAAMTAPATVDRLVASQHVPQHVVPPDQSDPPFLSLPSILSLASQNQRLLHAPLHTVDGGARAVVVSLPRAAVDAAAGSGDASAAAAPQFRHAVVVPLGRLRGAVVGQSMSLVALSHCGARCPPPGAGSSSPSSLVATVRFFADIGDAHAASAALNASAADMAGKAVESWSDILAPSADSGGELVVEWWASRAMMCAEDLEAAAALSSSVDAEFVVARAFVQTPVTDDHNGAAVARRLPGEVSAVGVARRRLSEAEVAFLLAAVSALRSRVESDAPTVEHSTDAMPPATTTPTTAMMMMMMMTACAWCGRVRESNRRCGRCLGVAYCCRAHQALHFRDGGHRRECASIQRAAAEVDAAVAVAQERRPRPPVASAAALSASPSLMMSALPVAVRSGSAVRAIEAASAAVTEFSRSPSASADASHAGSRSIIVLLPRRPSVESSVAFLKLTAEAIVASPALRALAAAANCSLFVTLWMSPFVNRKRCKCGIRSYDWG